jgi:uncharacterized membrane protein
MLSSVLPPRDLRDLKVNMMWDGFFHAATWLMTLVGVLLLFRAGRDRQRPWSGRTLGGGLALGWGLFNLVEGLVDHQLLGLHHVHPGPGQLTWDVGFLAFGAALVVAGVTLVRTAVRRAASG